MTILAVGDEVESWPSPLNTTSDVQTTVKDTGQRGGINASNTQVWDLTHTSVSEVWVHFIGRMVFSGSTPTIALRNTATGKNALQILYNTANSRNQLRIERNSTGTTYVNVADVDWNGSATASSGTHYFDMYFKNGASGVLKVWIDGRLVLDISGNYTTVDATWNCLRLASSSNGNANLFGGVIVADESTLGMSLDHLSPNGSGSVSAWSGNFNALADTSVAPRMDLTTSISSNTAGQAFLATMEDTALHSSKDVRALQIAARGVIEAASSITSVSFLARESSTNYTLNDLGLTSTTSSYQQVLDTSPAGNVWTDSIVNDLELGVISA